MNGIYLSLGSNIGARAGNIARALAELPEHGVRVVGRSSLYETEPVEDLAPVELMRALLGIERAMGRERVAPKGPRIIDVDILLYGSRVVREADLEIPHPRMAERRFVLVPFAEIAPGGVHPVLKKTVAELLAETADRSEVRLFS